MADWFSCEVEIGGELTLKQIEKIAEICDQSGGGLDWDESAPEIDEIIEAIEEDGELYIRDGQARNGEMEELTTYLKAEKIPFIERQDGKHEYNAELNWFDGEKMHSFDSNQSGDQLVQASSIKEALEMIDTGKAEEGIALLRTFVIEPKLPPVSVKKDDGAAQ